MNYLNYSLRVLMGLFTILFIVKIYMVIANHVGQELGIGKFVIGLWQKIKNIADRS